MILVTITPETGTLARYECGGELARLTHRASLEQPVTFTAAIVRYFRSHPEERFAIEPDFTPPWRPGGTPAAARAA